MAALWRAVLPYTGSTASLSAPNFSSASVQSAWPFQAAHMSAVAPSEGFI